MTVDAPIWRRRAASRRAMERVALLRSPPPRQPGSLRAVLGHLARSARTFRHHWSPDAAAVGGRDPFGPRTFSTGRLLGADRAPGDAVFLRSFDRLEQILGETYQLAAPGRAVTPDLAATVRHLTAIGFLSRHDRQEWAACLTVRQALLLSRSDEERPSGRQVDRSTARMLQLHVLLTDRARRLFRQAGADPDSVEWLATRTGDRRADHGGAYEGDPHEQARSR